MPSTAPVRGSDRVPRSLDLLQRCIPLFETLEDPQRQAIVVHLIVHGPETVGDLADASPLSRTAVSHHIQILERSGLVSIDKIGTRRICEARVDEGLQLLRDLTAALEADLADAQQCLETGPGAASAAPQPPLAAEGSAR